MLEVFAISQIPEYLATGFWLDMGQEPRAFADTTITVYLDQLTDAERAHAEHALGAWAEYTALEFEVVDYFAQINVYSASGFTSFAVSNVQDGVILSSDVYVSPILISNDPVWAQTFIHEIGHALGLGHPGPYNGAGWEPIFTDDNWHTSVMSYVETGHAPITPMWADVEAMQLLYGEAPPAHLGDTLHEIESDEFAFVVDGGGYDTLSIEADNAVIDLRPGAASDHLHIGDDTYIEVLIVDGSGNHVITGDGDDLVFL